MSRQGLGRRVNLRYDPSVLPGGVNQFSAFPWESWLIRSPHTRKILGSNPSGDSLFWKYEYASNAIKSSWWLGGAHNYESEPP